MAKNKSEKILRELLEHAGITINGIQPYDIKVHNDKFYDRVLREKELGLGESYMDGWWDCEALDQLVDHLLRASLQDKVKGNWKIAWHTFQSKIFNLQKGRRARKVAEQHYDLGNDLFRAMLDDRMNYTCAYWKNAGNLDEAQEAKLELVCKKIGLEPGMTVLELGCGFGSFAGYAAEKYGAKVTGYNISRLQVEYARERYKDLPVEFILDDYRKAAGEYDRVISIGIMEHVGYKNYRSYMEVVDRTLKKDGIAFIHTIGGNYSTTIVNAWTAKYIFPEGMIPSIAQLGSAMENLFVMEDWHNFGPDYDKTLMCWYENFERGWQDLKDKYGERFRRMWHYYLLSSAGGFRARTSQLWQIVMTRPGTSQPNCRIS